MLYAGQPVRLNAGSVLNDFDFGAAASDPNAAYNLMRGYTAAFVYDNPGAYAILSGPSGAAASQMTRTNVTVVRDDRPVIQVQTGDDLAKILGTVRTAAILLLAAGDHVLRRSAIVAAAQVTLRGVAGTRIVRSGNDSSLPMTVQVNADDCSVENIEFDSDRPLAASSAKVNIYAICAFSGNNLFVRNCTFRNVDDGVHCFPNTRGLVVLGGRGTVERRACGVWTDFSQQAVIYGYQDDGSQHEHCIRSYATGLMIHGCTLANTDGKETIALREGSQAAVSGNVLGNWMRISEGVQPATPTTYCRNILVSRNQFAGAKIPAAWLNVDPGCDNVWIDCNTFDAPAGQLLVSVNAPAMEVKATANLVRVAKGAKAPALIQCFGGATVSESGTTAAETLAA